MNIMFGMDNNYYSTEIGATNKTNVNVGGEIYCVSILNIINTPTHTTNGTCMLSVKNRLFGEKSIVGTIAKI